MPQVPGAPTKNGRDVVQIEPSRVSPFCDHPQVVIDVHIGVDDGAVGFLPKQWPPGPVVVGTVMPHKVVAQHGVQEGDVLKLVANQKASQLKTVSNCIHDCF